MPVDRKCLCRAGLGGIYVEDFCATSHVFCLPLSIQINTTSTGYSKKSRSHTRFPNFCLCLIALVFIRTLVELLALHIPRSSNTIFFLPRISHNFDNGVVSCIPSVRKRICPHFCSEQVAPPTPTSKISSCTSEAAPTLHACGNYQPAREPTPASRCPQKAFDHCLASKNI